MLGNVAITTACQQCHRESLRHPRVCHCVWWHTCLIFIFISKIEGTVAWVSKCLLQVLILFPQPLPSIFKKQQVKYSGSSWNLTANPVALFLVSPIHYCDPWDYHSLLLWSAEPSYVEKALWIELFLLVDAVFYRPNI